MSGAHLPKSEAVLPDANPASGYRVTREVSRSDWDDYVQRSPGASIYHQYVWRDVIRGAHGTATHYLAALDDQGKIAGILPLARLRSVAFGDFLVSLPYFSYGGIVASSAGASAALISAAKELSLEIGASHVELRQVESLQLDLPTRLDKVTMILPLPQDSGEMLRRLGSKLRSQIKRSEREGATGRTGGAELLGDFYDVFCRKMRDLGTPVYSRRLFAEILARLGDVVRVFVIYLAGKPVAASVTLQHGNRIEVPWAASLREYDKLSVNMLLYWRMIQYAIEQNCADLDFGRCTPDTGPHRFKRQWGAVEHQLHWHYCSRSGSAPPILNHSNGKFALPVLVWKKLPLPVANWLGPHIVKHLP